MRQGAAAKTAAARAYCARNEAETVKRTALFTGFFFLIAMALFLALGAGAAKAESYGAGGLTGVTPALLSDEDQTRYRKIFRLQEDGRWREADRLVDALEDRALMGHVLYQRYMHPTAYRSKFSELKSWLDLYNDHPGASKIHKLAMKRRPRGAAYPAQPLRRLYRQRNDTAYSVAATQRSFSRSYRKANYRVRSYLRRERPTQSLGYLNRVRGSLSALEYDTILTRIAGSYFIEDRNDRAYEESVKALKRSGEGVPLAYWYAGLASWRMNEPARAADYFAVLARAQNVNDWTRAAGGFWAARAYLASRQPEHVAEMLEIAASAAHIPASYRAAQNGSGHQAFVINAGLFPVPDYAPSEGFRVDRALLFAFMRQESKFQPQAKSYAGARGLMQIMPATASHITQDRSLRRSNRDKLFEPSFNASLGQQYLQELMNMGDPHGNLIMLAAAYNGGPGNLNRWLKQVDYREDPLLFLESIPAAETRGYVERVITNLWMYRDRLGQLSPSLDTVAAGAWPLYQPMERGGQLARGSASLQP
jgi:soluble lytic murein transglycosylase-like protein